MSERRSSFRKALVRASSLDSNSALNMGEAEAAPVRPGGRSRSKAAIIPELAALMVYTAGVKYQGFSKLVEYKSSEMFSVSEKVANKLLRSAPTDFIKHNRTHLSRVYPQGTRLSSSNYLPHQYWAMGCQLVSLNWQTYGMTFFCSLSSCIYAFVLDVGFAINHAMFARNGRCGWLLKPEAIQTRNKNALGRKEERILSLDVRMSSPSISLSY